jgi:hypothetical protein
MSAIFVLVIVIVLLAIALSLYVKGAVSTVILRKDGAEIKPPASGAATTEISVTIGAGDARALGAVLADAAPGNTVLFTDFANELRVRLIILP